MLFSSVAPRQRMVTLRAWVEKKSAAWPAELPAPTMWTSWPCVCRRLAASRAVGDPLPGEAFEALDRELPPGDAAGEDDRARSDDIAAVEVDLARRGVDALDRAGDEDLGAEPACLLQRAAGELVAGHAGREAEVVLDPRGGTGLTAGSLTFHDDRCAAPRTRRRPPRPDQRVRRRRSTVSYSAKSGSVPSPRSSATRRSWGRITVLPPMTRIVGRSASCGSGPSQMSPAFGSSGVIQRNVTWLRSRKSRRSVHSRPTDGRRRSRVAEAARRRGPGGRAGRSSGARRGGRHPGRGRGAVAAIAW